MRLLQLTTVIALCATAFGYSCPNDGHTFFHAVVSTGCQVYHRCENGQMSTMTCPSGQAFDHHSSQCVDAAAVHCVETDGHHRHKRSDVMVHTISLEDLKKSLKELFEAIVLAIRKALQDSAPTVLELIDSEYAPVVNTVKNDVEPIFKDKILPRLIKFFDYSKRVAGRVINKAYQSWEMSNSTHINLVSFSDLASDLKKDMQPVLQMGRYLSSRLAPKSRAKRSATTPVNEVPELMLPLLEPYFQPVADSILKVIDGEENSVLSKVILPVLKEMLADEEALFDLKRIFWSFKAAYFPLLHEVMDKQSFYTPEGTIIQIPNSKIEEAEKKFKGESWPIMKKLLHNYGRKLLFTASDHVPLILDSLAKFRPVYGNHAGVFSDLTVRFLLKHKNLFKLKNGDFTDSHTVTEIVNDLKPIGITILQVVSDYLSQMEDSWYSFLFNKDSFIYRILNAGEPSYAVPSGNGYGGRPSNNGYDDNAFLGNNRVYNSNRRF
ncbi:uncharacterized protein LOC129976451 [Argiope bruennichi]|uniref:Chitin-binding type-2 domain-containing protein n=1 Tax=Argiope bruennichi TaxID=94029 RepID=A0A8T0ER94_ARGBR|nr:uncharacterized protein LOC129976451 [Argiope bruennichi]KAF8778340.1 hypothetical protein HNY73_015071 [Argiope bruennichi]